MYVLECSPAEVANVCEEKNQEQKSSDGSGAADLQVWHARLGHLPTKMLKGMAIRCIFLGYSDQIKGFESGMKMPRG